MRAIAIAGYIIRKSKSGDIIIERTEKMITVITNENYGEEVVKSSKPVIIDFWADWCGPCRMMSEVIDDIAETRQDIKVCKVNVDDEKDLAVKFAISAIPTVMLVKEGVTAKTLVGYRTKEELLSEFGL